MMETIYNSAHFLSDLKHPYAWPGGYPRFFITSDGAALSYEAAKENKELIVESINSDLSDGWKVEACDINWEDTDLICDHTGNPIESAYAE